MASQKGEPTVLTSSQQLLVAAAKLEASGQRPFSASALVVEAWKQFPQRFSLKGFPQYPDSNAVFVAIMGPKSLVARKYMLKVGQKLYQLTNHGAEEAQKCIAGQPSKKPLVRVELSSWLKLTLLRWLQSTAYRRFKDGHFSAVTYKDALKFWNLDASDREVSKHLAATANDFDEIQKHVNGSELDLDGWSVSAADVRTLREVDCRLRERFARHLELQAKKQPARSADLR